MTLLIFIFETYIEILTVSFTYHCLPGITISLQFVDIMRKGKGKGKVHPRTGHESPEGE
jgi:hypothetical protein